MTRNEDEATPVIYFTDNDGNADFDPTPPSHCAERIKQLTTDQLLREGKSSEAFSAKPILMTVFYQNCCNLSVIDTPGLRPNDKTWGEEIARIVRSYLTADAIPVFIQNGAQEWVQSLLSDDNGFVRQWDKNLQRTIVCITKFDERLNSAHNKQSLLSFMKAEDRSVNGLHPLLGYNYVSVGVSNEATNIRDDIQRATISDIEKLLRSGFTCE
jgi:hypothetical protein